jgi:CHRD domain-containing protein
MRNKHHPGLALLAAFALVATLAIGAVTASGGRTFNLALSSAEEVPTPTDTATGTAWLQINPGQREVCFEITWDDVAGMVTASHIHIAPVGVAGPVVVPLFTVPQASDANGDGSASGCAASTLSASELATILAKPADYYVNVHSTLNGAGAIRAQLGG